MVQSNNESCSLYIHIPFCVSKCDYCDFFSKPIGFSSIPDSYIDSVINEINYRKKQFEFNLWKTIYIGGGTPSRLSQIQLKKLFSVIIPKLANNAEVTIEMNSGDVSVEYLNFVSECGVNRISVGIQSFNDKALQCVHRRSDSKEIINALKSLVNWRDQDTENRQLSLDLIAGLPNQSESEFLDGLHELIKYSPNHISLYALTLEEGTPLYSKMKDSFTTSDFDEFDDNTAKQWEVGCKLLEESGYNRYEVSNFSKKGCESRHNLTYWKTESYVGCGAGATGTIHNYGNTSLRYTNSTDIELYTNYWNNQIHSNCSQSNVPETCEFLDKNTQVFEYLMMGFRLLNGISGDDFYKRFGFYITDKIEPYFSDLCKTKQAVVRNGFYMLNDNGIQFLNTFLEKLL